MTQTSPAEAGPFNLDPTKGWLRILVIISRVAFGSLGLAFIWCAISEMGDGFFLESLPFALLGVVLSIGAVFFNGRRWLLIITSL